MNKSLSTTKQSPLSDDDLTAETLRRILDYDPQSGVFVWRNPIRKDKVGQIAGGIKADPNGQKSIRIVLTVDKRSKAFRAHRLAWLHVYGKWPDGEIDHVDHNPLNNAIANLRDVSHQQNMRNQKQYANNQSGVTGLRKSQNGDKWVAEISGTYIGTYDTKDAADAARAAAEDDRGFHINHGV